MLIKKKYTSKINESASDDFIIENGVLVFYNGKDRNVVIPDGVTRIAYGSFTDEDMPRIASIKIPDTVTFIENEAFKQCSVERVTIPSSVKYIGNGAFSFCSSLKEIEITESLHPTASNDGMVIGDSAFYCVPVETITIPNFVKSIGNKAFSCCQKLKSVKISDSVKSIGDEAFAYCNSLESIEMPNPVIMSANTFYDTNLKKFNGIDISNNDDLNYFDLYQNGILIIPTEEFVPYKMNGEECYIKYIEHSAIGNIFLVVYSDRTFELFDWDYYKNDGFASLTDGIRLIEIENLYNKYPIVTREDGKQAVINSEYSGKWYDKCESDNDDNLYINGEKV